MSYLLRRLILIGTISCLAACANFKAAEVRTEAKLPYHHSGSDLKVSWQTIQTGKDATVSGLVKITRKVIVRNMDLSIDLLDSEGTVVSEGEVASNSVNMKMNDYFPFSVKLKDTTLVKGNVLEFIIRYHTNDGSWYGHAWQSSFQADALTGAVIEEQRL